MGTALMQGDTCNLCGYQGSQFRYRGHRNPVLNRLQVIGAQRRKANCPRCGSSDRDRLSYAGITQRIAFGPQPRILHIAPEKQLSAALQSWLKVKHPDAQYLGIDKRTGLYRYPSWVQDGDIRNLPFPDAHFDLVIANHVLEHIQSLDQALKELKRCLKPVD
ncbi:MAG: class I SAM-dependent methyltransferase [Bacteroidia bacterium]